MPPLAPPLRATGACDVRSTTAKSIPSETPPSLHGCLCPVAVVPSLRSCSAAAAAHSTKGKRSVYWSLSMDKRVFDEADPDDRIRDQPTPERTRPMATTRSRATTAKRTTALRAKRYPSRLLATSAFAAKHSSAETGAAHPLVAIAVVGGPAGRERMRSCAQARLPRCWNQALRPRAMSLGGEQEFRAVRSSASSAGHGTLLDDA